MKIHLKQIPPEGLHLEGEEDCLLSGLNEEEVRCAGPLQYNIDIGVGEGSLWANGSLSQAVELRCVSCLERFVHLIKIPNFSVHSELRGPEVVDLTPFVREDLLLNLPAHPRCDRDGSHVCKSTRARIADVELKPESDWSELDKLKIRES
jgi:uncharacterized metal-binding protein YceD (DUF177 family)